MAIELFDVVRVLTYVPEYGLEPGAVGVVVEIYTDPGPAYEVDFSDFRPGVAGTAAFHGDYLKKITSAQFQEAVTERQASEATEAVERAIAAIESPALDLAELVAALDAVRAIAEKIPAGVGEWSLNFPDGARSMGQCFTVALRWQPVHDDIGDIDSLANVLYGLHRAAYGFQILPDGDALANFAFGHWGYWLGWWANAGELVESLRAAFLTDAEYQVTTKQLLHSYAVEEEFWGTDMYEGDHMLGYRELLAKRELTPEQAEELRRVDDAVLAMAEGLPADASGWDALMLNQTAELIKQERQRQ